MSMSRISRLHRLAEQFTTRLAGDGRPRHEAWAVGLGCDERAGDRRPTTGA